MNVVLRFAPVALVIFISPLAAASEGPCTECKAAQPSWIFSRGTYTHDPYTGARVAQYMRTPPVEPLDDERNVTSRYRRSRTNLRGVDGSIDSTYEVQAWGNGRGGPDAEWERFHDAWKESYLQGGYSNGPAWGSNQGPWGFNGGGWNNGFPGSGFPGGGWGGPGNWGPGTWGPGNWNQQGPWNGKGAVHHGNNGRGHNGQDNDHDNKN